MTFFFNLLPLDASQHLYRHYSLFLLFFFLPVFNYFKDGGAEKKKPPSEPDSLIMSALTPSSFFNDAFILYFFSPFICLSFFFEENLRLNTLSHSFTEKKATWSVDFASCWHALILREWISPISTVRNFSFHFLFFIVFFSYFSSVH